MVPRFQANDNLIAAQARKVVHSCAKAMRLLGYNAPISYAEGMASLANGPTRVA